MLTAEQLKAVLIEAQKAASCTRFCRLSSGTEAGTYLLAHNGTGAGDTDSVRVYASSMTCLTDAQLQPHLVSWLAALHKRTRLDLNEAIS